MKLVFYYDTKGSTCVHTDAPVFAVVAWERGYHPIYTHLKAERLNNDIPLEVLQSALVASMFGWDCEGASVARQYVEAREQAIAKRPGV